MKNFATLVNLFFNNKAKFIKTLAFLSLNYKSKKFIEEPKQ
jgi:hypothetical protein